MNRVGMNVWSDLWLPTFLIKYCLAFLRMCGREATCLPACLPIPHEIRAVNRIMSGT